MIKMQKTKLGIQKSKQYGQLNASYQERLKWYQTPRWKSLRKRFLEENPYCHKCLENGEYVEANTVDHIEGHNPKEWKKTFWIGPFMALCSSHHSEKTVKEDMSKRNKRMSQTEKLAALNGIV